MAPVDAVAGVGGELADERALGAAVAVPERVDAVDLGQVEGQALDERIAVEVAQKVLAWELGEDLAEVGRDVLGQREQVALGDRDRSNLACPLVNVAEDLAVERLQVGQIVGASESPLLQDREAARGEVGLKAGELGGVADPVAIAKGVGARIDVR
ncbi:MAG: hypothetical protein ABSG43_24155, partial [Solirubrobacteraceae bacterium]